MTVCLTPNVQPLWSQAPIDKTPGRRPPAERTAQNWAVPPAKVSELLEGRPTFEAVLTLFPDVDLTLPPIHMEPDRETVPPIHMEPDREVVEGNSCQFPCSFVGGYCVAGTCWDSTRWKNLILVAADTWILFDAYPGDGTFQGTRGPENTRLSH